MDFKKWIEDRGMTQNWVAKQLGISDSYLYRILHDTCKPSSSLQKFIEYFMENHDILQILKSQKKQIRKKNVKMIEKNEQKK